MVYDRLNRVLDDLSLGNGAIYGLADFIGGVRLSGGLRRYTLERGYYLKNITKNYNGGYSGRYSYGTADYREGNGKEKIDGSTGVYLGMDQHIHPVPRYREMIGDYYTINGTERNSFKTFTTVDEFSALGEEIRNLNLSDNVNIDTFKLRYNDDEKFIGDRIESNEIGDDFIYTDKNAIYQNIFGNRKELLESSAQDRQVNINDNVDESVFRERYKDSGADEKFVSRGVVSNEIGESRVFTDRDIAFKKIIENRKDLKSSNTKDSPKENRNFLKSINFAPNSFYSNHPNAQIEKRHGQGSTAFSNFEDLWNFYEKQDDKDVVNNSYLGVSASLGLYNFYDDVRKTYSKKTIGGISGNAYWYGRAYANLKDTQQEEKYGIETEWGVQNVEIDASFKTGSFRTNNPSNKSATYSYYQERDKGSASSSLGETNTFLEFVAKIDSFNDSSEIMRAMNQKFANNEIKSLINRFHTTPTEADREDQLISAYDAGFGLSRGRNLVRKEYEGKNSGDKSSGFDNPYCRVWTAHHQYSKLKDRIRPFMQDGTFMSIKELQSNLGRLRPNNGAQRLSDYSTLQDNGFVKVTPYHDGKKLSGGKDSLKRYMFSIENLAWKGFVKDRLSTEQMGPFGGRIMWFPPYNLKFTENINTSWKDNDFIGRGEKIYTYVNTDRSGTLSFTLLIDHPSILNKSVGVSDNGVKEEDILRFFAGCGQLEVLDKELEPQPEDEINIDEDNVADTTQKLNPDSQYNEVKFIVFFPNNFSAKKYFSNVNEMVEKLDEYEMEDTDSGFIEMDTAWQYQILNPMNYNNVSEYGLNKGDWSDKIKNKISKLLDITDMDKLHPYSELKWLDDYYSTQSEDGNTLIFGYDSRFFEVDSIEVEGHASNHGYPESNAILSEDRAKAMEYLVKHFCGRVDANKIVTGECTEIPITKPGIPEDVNDLDAKIARCAIVTFKIKLRDDVAPSETNSNRIDFDKIDGYSAKTPENKQMYVSSSFHGEDSAQYYTYQNEFLYFQELKATDSLVYKDIVRKVKFFDPAYHSLTPEGFNSRLNFLQQCTRQGPTIASHNGGENPDKSQYSEMAGNLSFGMAPYCILRIGDFYYSKIVIDSISIDYDNGGGTQWDLNPEGAGVQPMLANVNMNFHFIGGQDIEGPVEQLQNALTFNYYANSSIYTPSTQQSMAEYDYNKEN